MVAPLHPLSRIRPIAGAVLAGAGLPLGLALVLTFLRPDLYKVMLDHEFGRQMVGGMVLMSAAATTLYLVSAVVPFRTRGPPRVLALLGLLLCTIPALLAIVLGPIVFIFMYGAAG